MGEVKEVGFPGDASGKRTCVPMQEMQETQVQPLGQEDSLEEGMATLSSILVWRIPWTVEPGKLHFIGPHRVRCD